MSGWKVAGALDELLDQVNALAPGNFKDREAAAKALGATGDPRAVPVLQALRVRRGYVGMKAPYEPVVVSSFWSFTAGAAAVGWLAFALLPLAFAR